MATFNELVRAIAEVEGMDVMTVTGIGQLARDAQMITKGGRGRSAARMSARDASRILMAVNASALAKDAASAIETFESLPFLVGSTEGKSGIFLDLAGSTIRFGDALERLLIAFTPKEERELEAARIFAELLGRPDDFEDLNDEFLDYALAVAISFRRPRPSVTITVELVDWLPWNENPPPDRIKTLFAVFAPQPEPFTIANRLSQSDRIDNTIISQRTLRSVGRILAA